MEGLIYCSNLWHALNQFTGTSLMIRLEKAHQGTQTYYAHSHIRLAYILMMHKLKSILIIQLSVIHKNRVISDDLLQITQQAFRNAVDGRNTHSGFIL
jgi:hypothetical protein